MRQYKGVKAKITKETCETWTYPGHRANKLGWRLHHKVWKNWCPFCYNTKSKATKGIGVLRFNPKKTDTGELTCSKCDADFDCVDGWEKSGSYRKKLKTGTLAKSSSATTKASKGAVQTKKCNLTKAQAKVKAEHLLQTDPDKTWSIEIPLMTGLKCGDYINITEVEGYDNGNYFINEIKEDYTNGTMSLELLKGRFHYGVKYDGEYLTTNQTGAITSASSKNPLKAKPKYINAEIGTKAKSTIEKKIKLKGKSLGTLNAIYKWLIAGTGTGKFRYKYYCGHYYKAENTQKHPIKSLKKCWTSKRYNCVDGAWIFALMCNGAGINMKMVSADYTNLDGSKGAHMYNYYKKNGKYYDVTNTSNITPTMKKVEQVKPKTKKKKK